MSFSSDIKQELNNLKNLSNKELVKYELIGYLLSGNTYVKQNNIEYTTESDYNINRFSKLLSNLNINHNIDVSGKVFIIYIKKKEIETIVITEKEKIIISKEIISSKNQDNLRAIVRGIFLGSGSINNPENKYHLEMTFSNGENLELGMNILEKLGIKTKKMVLKNKYYIYIKEGEEISKLLAVIGANKAVMQFEDVRVRREMRGKVNRIVNCETANLNKTINASVEQIAAIQKLKEKGAFNKLDNNLKEIAELRLENPETSLIDLGKLLKNPVGKSGVNYRLKKIMEIADEL
jgi:hypothetical protein